MSEDSRQAVRPVPPAFHQQFISTVEVWQLIYKGKKKHRDQGQTQPKKESVDDTPKASHK